MKMNIIILSVLFGSMALSGRALEFNAGLTSFASDIYQKCIEESADKSIIISPLSISTALALLSQGTQSHTFEQIANGLHLENDKNAIAADFAKHRDTLYKRIGTRTNFTIINQLYVQQGYEIKKAFRDVAENQFKSGVETLNLAESTAASAHINSFVESATNNKIKNLIKPDVLNSDSRLVLINAVYFKSYWTKRFSETNTKTDKFFTSETDSVDKSFMQKTEIYDYANLDDLDAIAVAIPYRAASISFVMILPNSRTGLSALEAALRTYDFTKITSRLKEEGVDLMFPKFEVNYEIELNDVLSKLGINEIFGNADFGGLLETNERLYVSKAIHKAFIEINEDGTEAAAGSGFGIQSRMGRRFPTDIKTFKADHPFLFYILDVEQNTILFSGRLLN